MKTACGQLADDLPPTRRAIRCVNSFSVATVLFNCIRIESDLALISFAKETCPMVRSPTPSVEGSATTDPTLSAIGWQDSTVAMQGTVLHRENEAERVSRETNRKRTLERAT